MIECLQTRFQKVSAFVVVNCVMVTNVLTDHHTCMYNV